MSMPFKLVSLAIICAVSFAFPAWAHHSHGNYDVTKWTIVEGKVKEVHLINPHSWVYVEVKDDKGQTAIWAMETTNPISLERKGVGRGFLKTGDTIKARCHQLKDGTNGCLLGFLTPMHGDAARGHGVEKEWD
jgi:hypothetical protein